MAAFSADSIEVSEILLEQGAKKALNWGIDRRFVPREARKKWVKNPTDVSVKSLHESIFQLNEVLIELEDVAIEAIKSGKYGEFRELALVSLLVLVQEFIFAFKRFNLTVVVLPQRKV